MMDLQVLLSKCRDLGATFSATPEGKLKVQAPAPLPDTLRQELKERKAEILATLSSWSCPRCGQPALIEDVCRSRDGQRWLTFWRCDLCQVSAVTPDTIKVPPVCWVSRTVQ